MTEPATRQTPGQPCLMSTTVSTIRTTVSTAMTADPHAAQARAVLDSSVSAITASFRRRCISIS